MKAGSQFIIALRLLSTVPRLSAHLTVVSRSDQLHLYCFSHKILLVETASNFPSTWLLQKGFKEQAAELQTKQSADQKIKMLRHLTERPDVREAYHEAVRKQATQFFTGPVQECKLKMETYGDAPAVMLLNEFFYDIGAPFVKSIAFDELLQNVQIPFRTAPDYLSRTSGIRITAQEGYLISRLEQPHSLGQLLSMVPGDEETTRRTLMTLWSFGVIDSSVLDQMVPKIDAAVFKVAEEEAAAAAAAMEPAKSARGEDINVLRDLINQTYQALNRRDYYSLLGVSTKADMSDVKGAYYQLARKFHPDRFYGVEDPVLKEKVDIIFSAINVAYETLKNAKRRLEYDSAPMERRTISTGPLNSESQVPAAAPNKEQLVKAAEDHAKRAQKSYEGGNYYQAVQYLRSATQIAPEVAKYWRQLGISLSRNPQWRKEAEDSFQHSMDLEPRNPENHLYMGFLYKNAGLKLRARKHFASCIELDPANEIAARELRMIDESEEKERTDKKGLLGGLFNKKK